MSTLASTGNVLWIVLCLLFSLYFVFTRYINDSLKAFPGPKLASRTRLYVAYYESIKGGLLLEQLQKLHKRYGPVVRIGPNLLHFSDPRAYRDIYNTNQNLTKEPAFYDKFGEQPSVFSTTDPSEHKFRHGLMSPLFSRRAIANLESVIQGKVDLLIEQMKSYNTKPINMSLALRSAALDIITSYCFATSCSALTFPSFQHPLVLSMQAGIAFPTFMQSFPLVGTIMKLLPERMLLKMSPAAQGLFDYRKSMTTQVDNLLANPESLRDCDHETIFHHLMDPESTKNTNRVVTRGHLLGEGINIIFAGSDTVANTCVVGIFHALNKDDVRLRLRQELKEAWPGVDVRMEFEMLRKLPYLTAVIKEALRLSPGAPSRLPRVVGPAAIQVMGLNIPAGTTVSMTHLFMHWNEEIFPDARTFYPERWLQTDTKELESHFVPFSRGSRSCLGLNLAWCELYLLFANVFHKLDLEIDGTTVADLEFRAYSLPQYLGRPLYVKARERTEDLVS